MAWQRADRSRHFAGRNYRPLRAYGLTRPAALNGPQFLTADVLAKPLRIEEDQAHVPTGPGLGVEVDEQKVVELMRRSGGDRLLR